MIKDGKGRRTGLDFSRHELIVTKNELVTIHHLKKPGTIIHSVKFINVEGSLVVKGDFGNWIFCREFIPDASNELISDGYWCEKLEISSKQTSEKFDADLTRKRIDELIAENSEDAVGIEYLENLKTYLDEGEEYFFYAQDNLPSKWDYENIPYCKSPHYWLLVIFDAFEHCCAILGDSLTPTNEKV